jgi:hypothetical protein
MTIQYHWEDAEQTILHVTFSPQWTLDEYHHYLGESTKLIKAQPHIVDMITDFGGNMPSSRDLLSAKHRITTLLAPNIGLNVVAKPGSFMRSIIEVGWRVGQTQMKVQAPYIEIKFATTVEEALNMIRQRQQKRLHLPDASSGE